MWLGFADSPHPGVGLWACSHLLPTGRASELSVTMRAAYLSMGRRTSAHPSMGIRKSRGKQALLSAVPCPKAQRWESTHLASRVLAGQVHQQRGVFLHEKQTHPL